MTDTQATSPFRLAFAPGVTPSKWIGVWRERLPEVPLALLPLPVAAAEQALHTGGADVGLLRLPVDRTVMSAIPLYLETTVVVIPKDHRVAEAAEVSVEDLAEEIVLHPLDDVLAWESLPGLPAISRPATTSDAIDLVAAGIGVLVVPQSLARLHHRKDLVYRPVTDAPQSQVALVWPEDRTTDLVEEFIGIVRGRTVNSTRGRAETAPQPKQKRAAAADKRQQPGRTGKSGAAGKTAGGRPRTGSGKPKPATRAKPRRRS